MTKIQISKQKMNVDELVKSPYLTRSRQERKEKHFYIGQLS